MKPQLQNITCKGFICDQLLLWGIMCLCVCVGKHMLDVGNVQGIVSCSSVHDASADDNACSDFSYCAGELLVLCSLLCACH